MRDTESYRLARNPAKTNEMELVERMNNLSIIDHLSKMRKLLRNGLTVAKVAISLYA